MLRMWAKIGDQKLCAVHLECTHSACTVQNTQFVQFCFWRRGGTFFVCGEQLWRWKCVWIGVLARAKRNLFKLAFAHPQIQKTNLLCFVWWVAALKMKVRLDWGFGKFKREFVQACVCTSTNQKKIPGLSPGSSKKNSHPVTLIDLRAPFPPIQCWERLSKKNSHFGLDAGMHWAATLIKGARGGQVWWSHVGGWPFS